MKYEGEKIKLARVEVIVDVSECHSLRSLEVKINESLDHEPYTITSIVNSDGKEINTLITDIGDFEEDDF